MLDRPLFKNPWWIVFGSVFGLIVSSGPVTIFTFGVFLKPMVQDLGWSRATLGFALVISQIFSAIATPIAGKLMDRYGIRRVSLPMIVFFPLSTAAVSLAPNSPRMLTLLFALWGFASAFNTPLSYSKSISARFEGKRGLALGIAMAGVGLGGAVLPQIVRVLIGHFGWRGAFVGLGAVVFLFAFPSVLFFVRETRDSWDTAENTSISHALSAASVTVPGMTAWEAMKGSPRFWYMAVAAFCVAGAVNGATQHIVAILTDRSLTIQFATYMVTVAGIAMIVGRIVSGYLLDVLFAPYVAAFFFSVPLIGIVILGTSVSADAQFFGSCCLGVGIGAEVALLAFLVGRYFGLRSFAQIYGYLFGLVAIASGVGPWLMDVCFDATHSYTLGLYGLGAAIIVASVLISRLGPYSYPVLRVAIQSDASPAAATTS